MSQAVQIPLAAVLLGALLGLTLLWICIRLDRPRKDDRP